MVPLDRVVAIVDNDVIMQSQLDQRLREVHQTLLKRGAPLPPEHVLTQQVLERLIIENIQQQIGDRSGIRISDEELNQAMGTIAQRNGMSLEQFQAALTRDGLSYADAREQVRREMVISRVRQRRVAERIQVSEQEVKNFLPRTWARSSFRRVPPGQYPDPGAGSRVLGRDPGRRKAGPGALPAAQAGRRLRPTGDFPLGRRQRPGRRRDRLAQGCPVAAAVRQHDRLLAVGDVTEPVRTPGGFIILKLEEKRGGSKMVRDEVHVRHILLKPSEIRSEAETEKLAQKLYERIQSGEDFGELAKSFSEDPGSALNGGDLNWIDPEALVPEFRQVMNDTPQGELSKPFRSQFGWHILQVLGRRATDSSEKFREQQAVSVLRNRKYDEELQAWLRQIRDEAYVEIKQ